METAIVLPILVLLIFGIIQFSIVFNRVQGLHAAAREGARIGALSQTTNSQINARVRDALNGVVDPDEATISVDPDIERPCNDGERVIVRVTHDYEITIPLWGTETVGLTGRGEFRCE